MGGRNGKIGVFDSGFGGIDVLRGITQELPEYDYLYLGDTARTPYGTRSQDVVCGFTRQAVDFFFERDCELVIFACNTASSDALRFIQHQYLPAHHADKKVLGVLIPASEAAVSETRNSRVGIIATEGTVNSKAFEREVHNINPTVRVFQQACPLLVPIVEAGAHDSDIARMALTQYLAPLLDEGIDTLILGCTHYGILESMIRDIVGPDVAIVSEARVVPEKLRTYLERQKEIETTLSRGGSVQFYSTDVTDRFERLGSIFFGAPVSAEKVSLQ